MVWRCIHHSSWALGFGLPRRWRAAPHLRCDPSGSRERGWGREAQSATEKGWDGWEREANPLQTEMDFAGVFSSASSSAVDEGVVVIACGWHGNCDGSICMKRDPQCVRNSLRAGFISLFRVDQDKSTSV